MPELLYDCLLVGGCLLGLLLLGFCLVLGWGVWLGGKAPERHREARRREP